MTAKSCFIIGLPSAGKTTYLAALSFSLEQKKIKTKLHWDTFTENHQYLTNLANTWLEATPVSRTNIMSQQASLTVELIDDIGTKCSVSFPDLSGETFQNQYKDREIEKSTANAIRNCNSIMLFINPSEIHEPTWISSIPKEIREGSLSGNQPERDPTQDDPTEVQLVELLQFVEFLKGNKYTPLSVMVSAWDKAQQNYSIPEKCVKDRLPLLWQYLYTNSNIFNTCYYGISAQGGELSKDEEASSLLKRYRLIPAERICVVNNAGEICHDISLPLWISMNADQG